MQRGLLCTPWAVHLLKFFKLVILNLPSSPKTGSEILLQVTRSYMFPAMQAVGKCISTTILFSETSYYSASFWCHLGSFFNNKSEHFHTKRSGRCLFLRLFRCTIPEPLQLQLPVFKYSHCTIAQFLCGTPVYTMGQSNNCSSFHGHPVCHEDMVLISLISSIFLHSSGVQKAWSIPWILIPWELGVAHLMCLLL